jgi:acyl-coenzyme A thioesterase PaaI-like protein
MTESLAAQIETALRDVAGAETRPSSLTIDYGPDGPEGGEDADLQARAWVERSTRSLVFAQAELRRRNGSLAAAGSAVFRRIEA